MSSAGAETGITRRGVLGAAAVAGAAHVLPAATSLAGQRKPCATRPPGLRRGALALAPGGRTLWTTDTTATTITAYRTRDLARRRAIEIGVAPAGLALSPDGRHALVTAGLHDGPGGLVVVDLAARDVVRRIDVGPAPEAVAYAPDGRSAYVAGGGAEGRLVRVHTRSGRAGEPIALGAHPRGLAVTSDGEHALVALNGEAAVCIVALDGSRAVRRIATGPFPYLVAIAPGGGRAYVGHNGFGARSVTPLDLRHARAGKALAVGLDPAGLAFSRSGALLAVAERGAGTVSIHDARSGRRRRRLRTGGWPRAVVLAGRRAFVMDGQTGHLSAVAL